MDQHISLILKSILVMKPVIGKMLYCFFFNIHKYLIRYAYNLSTCKEKTKIQKYAGDDIHSHYTYTTFLGFEIENM